MDVSTLNDRELRELEVRALASIAGSLNHIDEQITSVMAGLKPLTDLLNNKETRQFLTNIPALMGAFQMQGQEE